MWKEKLIMMILLMLKIKILEINFYIYYIINIYY